MNHKKRTIAIIIITTLFSFGSLRPMLSKINQGKPTEKLLNEVKREQEPDFENIENLILFEDKDHLREIIILHKRILDFTIPNGQKMGIIVKPFVDWGLPIITIGWTLKNLLCNDGWKNWKSYIVPIGLGLASSAYHVTMKEPYKNVVQDWKEKRQQTLYLQQVGLEAQLKRINCAVKDDLALEDSDNFFKSIAFLQVLRAQAQNSKNFEPFRTLDLRSEYNDKISLATITLDKLQQKRLEKFIPGARKKITKLMHPKDLMSLN